jgi:hypothetical protein
LKGKAFQGIQSDMGYLPMHAVFTPERTTKIRLVFNASAKGEDELSLNDHLEKGPNYINDLTSVIMA